MTFRKFEKTFKENKAHVIKVLTCLFFIIGILMSYNLWISDRNFPMIPVFNEWPIILPLDNLIFLLLILSLTLVMFIKTRALLCLIFLILIFLLLQDQIRWQPWVYIYILFLLPFTLYSNIQHKSVTNYFRILLIGIYIWSGIHKLNPNFNELIVESFSVHLLKISSSYVISIVKSLGSLFAITEILSGFLLVFPKTRKIGVYLITGIHLFIILYISPLGINYNYIVLPWNIFMVITVIVLFFNSNDSLFFNSNDSLFAWLKSKNQLILKIVIFLVITLPTLSYFNHWDSYLSFSLYSGKINNYYVILPYKYEPSNGLNDNYLSLENQIENGKLLDINKWAMNELNVPMVPEDRIFKKIARIYCQKKEDNPIFISTELPIWKLMYFDFYRRPESHMLMENTIDELFYLKLRTPLKESGIRSFTCDYE